MEQYIKACSLLGDNIRKARKEKKITQEQLAAGMQLLGCDISRGTLAKIESGIRHISVVELKAIRQILNVDYKYFFNE